MTWVYPSDVVLNAGMCALVGYIAASGAGRFPLAVAVGAAIAQTALVTAGVAVETGRRS